MSPMLKALLAVKERGYNPPGPPPLERLALISEAERRLLKRLGGAGKLTRSGIPSFYMEGSTTGKREDSKPSQSKTTQSKSPAGNGGGGRDAGANSPSRDAGAGVSRSPTGGGGRTGGENNNNTGRDDRQPSLGTSKISNTDRDNASRKGIETPKAAGSPFNNPTKIDARAFNGSLNNIAIQHTAVRAQEALAAQRAQQLQAQYSQFRSPTDFPYAGAEDLTRDEYNRVQAGADIRPQNYGFQGPISRPRPITANVRPQNYGFVSPSQAEPHTPEGPADMFGPGYGLDPLGDPDRFAYTGRSKGQVLTGVHQDVLSKMMEAQRLFGKPVTPTSGFRNPFANKKAGGVGGSQHMQGRAIDFAINDTVGDDTASLLSAMKQAGFTGVGGYRPGKVHGDIGPERVWGPDTHASSIGQLPKSMQQALLGKPTLMAAADIPPPKPTVLGAVKKGYGAVKSFLAPPAPIPIPRQKPMQSNIVAPATSIPIPRQRPMVPSTVAKPTGIPIPRQKPSYPSTVAPATRIPIPRQKPAQTQVAYAEPTITPAGWSLNDIPGVDKIKTTYNTVNENVLKPIAQGVETYGQDATQRYVNAKIAAARNKQTRPTRYAQYGNMNRRRRQPITMGYV